MMHEVESDGRHTDNKILMSIKMQLHKPNGKSSIIYDATTINFFFSLEHAVQPVKLCLDSNKSQHKKQQQPQRDFDALTQIPLHVWGQFIT